MANQESYYRQIFKATSIFGGVQVFNILISIIKSKAIAILLGPAGIGLYGILNSTIEVLKSITGLGLGVSAVKDISEAAATENRNHISHTLKTLHRWVYFTGVFGCIITFLLAPLLSQWTFGEDSYTWMFRWLSVVLFFSAISSGQIAALQGMRQIGFLAKAGMWGSLLGLIISVPLFFLLGNMGIVLSIIISSLCTLLFSTIYARRIETAHVQQSYKESFKNGCSMAKLGIAMMFSGTLAILASYILKAYISRHGGIEDAGIYQSAFSVAEGYFGVIFTAMAADYYPRLAAINKDNISLKNEMNRQAEIGVLIAFPCIVIALFFMPIGIRLLYSEEFLGAIICINWAMMGNIFKIGSWSMSYILIAKGKSKTYAIVEFTSFILYLILMLAGYSYGGMKGIGIAFLIYYIFYFIIVHSVCNYFFNIQFSKQSSKLFCIIILFCIAAFCLQTIQIIWLKYLCALLLCSCSCIYTLRQLNKRMNIKQFILNKRKRK